MLSDEQKLQIAEELSTGMSKGADAISDLLTIFKKIELECRFWIPVKERMPEIGQDIVFIAPGFRSYVTYSKAFAKAVAGATHWCPIPPAPYLEEEQNVE